MKDPKIFWCHIPHKVYRKSNQNFEFLFTASNTLGTNEQVVPVDNYASVIPGPVENFKDVKLYSDRVELSWNVNPQLLVFPKPFDYEFLIVSSTECDSDPKRMRFTNIPSVDLASDHSTNFSQTINLKFTHTWYDISVRMRISTAPDVEEMWSKWAKAQVKSVMRRVDHPPAVDIGSFNIGPGGDIYIYWKHLQKCYQNGANYTNSITSDKGEFPHEANSHLAIYTKDQKCQRGWSLETSGHVGGSWQGATSAGSDKDQESSLKRKLSAVVVTTGSAKGTDHFLHGFLMRVNSCESSIDFVERSTLETHFEYTSSQTVNFAVSANSRPSTSGMIWARYTTANSNEIGKIKTIWIPRLASSQIEVECKLECTDSGIVAGYQLEYCPSKEPKTLECMEPQKKLNITGGLENPKHTLTGLMPYTTYKIIIRMFKLDDGTCKRPIGEHIT